jgi:putative hemolysin
MPVFENGTLEALPWAIGLLLCSFAFAMLRSSLQYSRTARVGSLARSEDERQRIESLLEHVERLSSSASLLKVCCELLFVALVLGMMTGDGGMQWGALLGSVAIAGPALLFIAEFLPGAFARRYGDQLLLKVLPGFDVLQRPLQVIILVLDGLNSAILRMLGVERETADTREIVEGLREVIKDSERRDDLNATERELIENVIEFSDVDVAEIMTPRTEIHGVDLEDGLQRVIQVAASEGHSSIPVFEDNLDNIIGYVSARGIVQLLADGLLESNEFRKNLRPVYFVPETKRVTDLLAEFRRGKRKMAIVLDEYGGTAGMVTLGDILGEIVGDVGDEYDRDDPEPVHFTSPGVALIEASLRIPELNEAMDLELSEEEDYETLGGFVLAEFGRFPRVGESFEREGTRYVVTDATDRRVLRVEVRAHPSGALS